MTAVRAEPAAPKIDGVLDDEVWQRAPGFTGFFVQQRPNEGQAGTESTTVQIVYDDDALYVTSYRPPARLFLSTVQRDTRPTSPPSRALQNSPEKQPPGRHSASWARLPPPKTAQSI